jgi:hypothetical protein
MDIKFGDQIIQHVLLDEDHEISKAEIDHGLAERQSLEKSSIAAQADVKNSNHSVDHVEIVK